MLFKDPRLQSKYDFGNDIDDEAISITALSKEIEEKAGIIAQLLYEGTEIELNHTNLHGETIYVPPSIDSTVFERDYISIGNILFRKTKNIDDTHSAISYHLNNMGIKTPTKHTEAFKRYLQLLYFFYMARYFIFPENNIFLLLKKDRMSTYFVAEERAEGGDYWYFILCNLFDDITAALTYSKTDHYFSCAIRCLATLLENLINEKNDPGKNSSKTDEVKALISQMPKDVSNTIQEEDPIKQMIYMVYQYQMLAYSGDMIKNLGGNNSPFCFKELKYDINPEWKNRYLKLTDIKGFINERNTLVFCRQEEIDDSRPEKKTRGNAFTFINEIIRYDEMLSEAGQPRLFTSIIDEEVLIPADYAALIVKTFFDINVDMIMTFPSSTNWKNKQKLQRALSSKSTTPTDLAMRLFVVAFHSEYLNTYAGHGYYYPLFKCIYLSNYLLLQEIVNVIFSCSNHSTWMKSTFFILVELQKL